MRTAAALTALLLTGTLRAEPEQAPAVRARTHFHEGLSAVEAGDLELASREFEAAYAAQPHFSVLYNIAQARLGLGQPLLAVESFERYLREGGAQVTPDRRAEVERLLTTTRRRLGALRLILAEPSETRVWLDGVELTHERLSLPISVVAGAHNVIYSVRAAAPVAQSVTIARGETAEVRIEPPPVPASLATVFIRCPVPGVRVELPGAAPATTPLEAPVRARSGAVTIRFSRPGYETDVRSIVLAHDAMNRVDCQLRPMAPLPEAFRAGLLVRPTPKDAATLVDAELFVGNPLPAGPHTLTTEREGFIPVTRTVHLTAGRTLHYEVELQPTVVTLRRLEHARRVRRTTGIGLTSAGAALLLGAGGLFLWNNHRYREWESRQATESTANTIDNAVSLQRIDDASIGLGVLGIGAAAAGAWLWFSPPGDAP